MNAGYNGPEFWIVRPVDAHRFDLTDQHGRRVATYPNAELAHKVRADMEAKALRAYLRAKQKGGK